MATLEKLIDELRAEGDFDSEGAFTLDREKARDKMRHFQLADPRAYVVELVQAAVLVGARRVEIELDADDMRMRFDGRAFDGEDLEQLYGAMFSRGDSGVLAARRQLALGLNAAMGLDPRYARLRSGAWEMELRPSQPDRITRREAAVQGTEIHVRDRLRGETLIRFVRNLRGRLAEESHLRERCRYVAIDLVVNGTQRGRAPKLPDLPGRIEFEEAGVRGVAGFSDGTAGEPQLTVLKHGVVITRVRTEALPPGFVAVFEADDVRKDISQTGIVRDGNWTRAVRAVKRALWPALRALAEDAREDESAAALFRRALLHSTTVVEMRKLVAAIRSGRTPDPTLAAIAAVPLWPSALEPAIAPRRQVSLAEVIAHIGGGRPQAAPATARSADYAARAMPEKVPWPADHPVPLITLESERTYLSRVLGCPLRDVADELETAIARAKNIARWRARAMQPAIPLRAAELVKVPFVAEGARGEVGLHVDVNSDATFWFVKDGCLLERRRGSGLLPGFVAAIEADFTPSKKHDHVSCNLGFLRIALRVAHAIPQLLSEIALPDRTSLRSDQRELALRKLAIGFLRLDFAGEGLEEWLGLWRVNDPRTLEAARRLLHERPVPATPKLETLLSDAAPAYARIALFDTLSGRRVSLAGIAQEIATHGTVAYLVPMLVDSALRAERLVVVADDAELATLRRVFGATRLLDFSTEFRAVAGRLRHQRQATVPIELRELGAADVHFEADGMRAHLCLLRPEPPPAPVIAHVRLLLEHRPLDVIRFSAPIGPIMAVVNDDELKPNGDWSGAADDARLAQVRQHVVSEAARLLARLARQAAPQHRKLVLNAAARLYGGRHEREAWAAELVSALEAAPLFRAASGAPVALERIRQEVERHGSVLYVSGRRELPADVERLVLDVAADERLVLDAIFATSRPDALAPGDAWLLRHARAASIRQAAPLVPIALAADDVLVKLAIDAPGVRGEVGLRRRPGPANLELRICHQGRLLATWQTGAALSLLAIVDDEHLPRDEFGLVDLDGPRPRALAALALDRVPALIARLLDEQGDGLAEAARSAAFIYLVDYLASEGRRLDLPSAEAKAVYERVRSHKMFAGVGGLYSFDDLQESYARFGEQAHLPSEPVGRPLDPRRIVLIAGPAELLLLARLFPSLRPFGSEWTRQQQLAAAAEHGPPLPSRPQDALEARSGAVRDGLRADLWLPADPSAPLLCAFGVHEKVVASRAISELFPCAGRVEGEGLRLAGTPPALELSEAQRESLERLAFRLYEQLAKDLYQPKHGRALQGARADAARHLLQNAARAYATSPASKAIAQDYRTFFETLGGPPLEGPVPDAGATPAEREAALIDALRGELGWVADKHAELLDALNLERIAVGNLNPELIAQCGTHGVTVNRRNPLVKVLLAGGPRDPVLLAWLASSVYTAMNHFWAEIEDDHEREFQAALIEDLIETLGAAERPDRPQ